MDCMQFAIRKTAVKMRWLRQDQGGHHMSTSPCWDRPIFYPAQAPAADGGYAYSSHVDSITGSTLYSWSGFLHANNTWADLPPANCSHFTSHPGHCGTHNWLTASPNELCCACNGGERTLAPPPTPPAQPPPLPPPSPLPPPQPPRPPPEPSPPPIPCFPIQLVGANELHLIYTSGGGWVDDGWASCDYFDTHVDPATACDNYTWVAVSPLSLCCACGGGTNEMPTPPPNSPAPSLPPPASPLPPLSPPAPSPPQRPPPLPLGSLITAVPGATGEAALTGATPQGSGVATGVGVPVGLVVLALAAILLLRRTGCIKEGRCLRCLRLVPGMRYCLDGACRPAGHEFYRKGSGLSVTGPAGQDSAPSAPASAAIGQMDGATLPAAAQLPAAAAAAAAPPAACRPPPTERPPSKPPSPSRTGSRGLVPAGPPPPVAELAPQKSPHGWPYQSRCHALPMDAAPWLIPLPTPSEGAREAERARHQLASTYIDVYLAEGRYAEARALGWDSFHERRPPSASDAARPSLGTRAPAPLCRSMSDMTGGCALSSESAMRGELRTPPVRGELRRAGTMSAISQVALQDVAVQTSTSRGEDDASPNASPGKRAIARTTGCNREAPAQPTAAVTYV